jgi:hypothetical protein
MTMRLEETYVKCVKSGLWRVWSGCVSLLLSRTSTDCVLPTIASFRNLNASAPAILTMNKENNVWSPFLTCYY